MKKLYVGETNAMNYIIVRDMSTDTAAVVEWDLPEDDINTIAGWFIENPNNVKWYACKPEWHDWNSVRDSYNTIINVG